MNTPEETLRVVIKVLKRRNSPHLHTARGVLFILKMQNSPKARQALLDELQRRKLDL